MTTRVLTKGGMSLNTFLVNKYSAQKCPWYDRLGERVPAKQKKKKKKKKKKGGGERYFSSPHKY